MYNIYSSVCLDGHVCWNSNRLLAFADHGQKYFRFPIPIACKQTDVCRFRFAFAANKQKLPFSISGIRKYGDRVMETWKHGDMEAWRRRHGNTDTWDMETRRYRDVEIKSNQSIKRKTEAQAIFHSLCLSCKQKFVICLFVDEETNGSYPFADLSIYVYMYTKFLHQWFCLGTSIQLPQSFPTLAVGSPLLRLLFIKGCVPVLLTSISSSTEPTPFNTKKYNTNFRGHIVCEKILFFGLLKGKNTQWIYDLVDLPHAGQGCLVLTIPIQSTCNF